MPSALKALQSNQRLSDILRLAVPLSHPHIVTFNDSLREKLLHSLQNAEVNKGVKWQRYPILNKLLKGHRPGELTVFTGPTGSGKTTFLSEYSLDLAEQGVTTLWGSFEIPYIQLLKTMTTQFAKTDLSKALDSYNMWADKFQALPIYFMTYFGEEEIAYVLEAMTHAVHVNGVKHVIIDNLQFMMGSKEKSLTDKFSRQDFIISHLRKFATAANCHVTLVVHPKKVENETNELTMQSVYGSAKATQEADNVLILQDYRLPSGGRRKLLQVTKNRFDGELGTMPLKFNKECLSFAVRPSTDDGKYKNASRISVTEQSKIHSPLTDDAQGEES